MVHCAVCAAGRVGAAVCDQCGLVLCSDCVVDHVQRLPLHVLRDAPTCAVRFSGAPIVRTTPLQLMVVVEYMDNIVQSLRAELDQIGELAEQAATPVCVAGEVLAPIS